MDGGISLNLIYVDTVKKMHIDPSRIEPSKTKFKGIIPGMEAQCSGRVTLDVEFSTPDNYCAEDLSFDIVPFWSSYHALLGRTAFARFHVVSRYAYMKLKMSGHKGTITVWQYRTVSLNWGTYRHLGSHGPGDGGGTKY